MLISVIGLGVEGQAATRSFLNYGHDVYASDFNKNLKIDIKSPNLDLEVGCHDLDKIFSSHAVSISPSLFHLDLAKTIIKKELFISDILNKHKSIKTIAVTGTNGKTTTTHMIYQILTNAGYKVAVGGNAGGGFKGYNDLLLESNSNDFDFILIEVCDMTLKFCDYFFNIDYVVVTNIAHDHMEIHKSIENFTREVGNFLSNKIAILNSNDSNLLKLKELPSKSIFYSYYKNKLNLFGKFNYNNADASYKLAIELGIDEKVIHDTLKAFNAVEGRTKQFNYLNKRIVLGKTDNIDALKAVLEEQRFETIIFGTARKGEKCRFKMLDYLASYNPSNLVIFQGLEDDLCEYYLKNLQNLGFSNNIKIINDLEEISVFIQNTDSNTIFIGGNGQEKLTQINNLLLD